MRTLIPLDRKELEDFVECCVDMGDFIDQIMERFGKHPSGGLVALDEEKLTDFLVAEGGEPNHRLYWKSKAKAIVKRFGQPETEVVSLDELIKSATEALFMLKIYYKPNSDGSTPTIARLEKALDDISKLNSTEG